MLAAKITRCCGTCFYWESQGFGDFSERCKYRFREPYCNRDNKPRSADSMPGCLGWKPIKSLKWREGVLLIKQLNSEVNNKEWAIKLVDDKFMVGALCQETNGFDSICSCESYDQADLIWAALKHYIYAKNYSSKGVGGCPGVIGISLKRIVRTGLPE